MLILHAIHYIIIEDMHMLMLSQPTSNFIGLRTCVPTFHYSNDSHKRFFLA